MLSHPRRLCLVLASVLLAVACGKSTTSSEASSSSSGGSSLEGSGGGHEASAGGNGGSGEATDTSSATERGSGATASTGTGGGSGNAATGGSTGGTADSDANSATSSGDEGGTTASGGDAGMSAEEMGCIIAGATWCPSPSETSFACPRDAAVPETCSECYEPMIDSNGHPFNQCLTALPDGTQCHYCCCEPSHSGCEERPDMAKLCQPIPDQPRPLRLRQALSGALRVHSRSATRTLVDQYCCP